MSDKNIEGIKAHQEKRRHTMWIFTPPLSNKDWMYHEIEFLLAEHARLTAELAAARRDN